MLPCNATPMNSAMNAICLIVLICLSVASITTAAPLETSFETPTAQDGGIQVGTRGAANPLAPALIGDWFRTPFFQWLAELVRDKQQ